MQNGPFQLAKQSVLRSNMARFATQNDPLCN